MLHHTVQKEAKFLDVGFVGVNVIDTSYEDIRGDFGSRNSMLLSYLLRHEPVSKGRKPLGLVLSKVSRDPVAML